MTLAELIEARKLLEVPAARLAAVRRSESDLERLRESIPGEPLKLDTQEQFVYNKGFHSASSSELQHAALHRRPARLLGAPDESRALALGRRFHREINDHHE